MLNPSHSESAFLFFPRRGKIQCTSSKCHFNSVRLSRFSEQAGCRQWYWLDSTSEERWELMWLSHLLRSRNCFMRSWGLRLLSPRQNGQYAALARACRKTKRSQRSKSSGFVKWCSQCDVHSSGSVNQRQQATQHCAKSAGLCLRKYFSWQSYKWDQRRWGWWLCY